MNTTHKRLKAVWGGDSQASDGDLYDGSVSAEQGFKRY